MYLDATSSITSAAFSASAWLFMPQSMSPFLCPHGRIPPGRRRGKPSTRIVLYYCSVHCPKRTHTPLAPVGQLLPLPGRAPQTVSLNGTASGAGSGSLQLCVWRVADLHEFGLRCYLWYRRPLRHTLHTIKSLKISRCRFLGMFMYIDG